MWVAASGACGPLSRRPGWRALSRTMTKVRWLGWAGGGWRACIACCLPAAAAAQAQATADAGWQAVLGCPACDPSSPSPSPSCSPADTDTYTIVYDPNTREASEEPQFNFDAAREVRALDGAALAALRRARRDMNACCPTHPTHQPSLNHSPQPLPSTTLLAHPQRRALTMCWASMWTSPRCRAASASTR